MTERGKKTQMPPLATEFTDSEGLAIVKRVDRGAVGQGSEIAFSC